MNIVHVYRVEPSLNGYGLYRTIEGDPQGTGAAILIAEYRQREVANDKALALLKADRAARIEAQVYQATV